MVKNTLISHFPLPSMPFDTHRNIVFEQGKSDKETRVQETHKAVDKKSNTYRHYVYHPHRPNNNGPQGELIDFVVA